MEKLVELWQEKKYRIIVGVIMIMLMSLTIIKTCRTPILVLVRQTGSNLWIVLFGFMCVVLVAGFLFYLLQVKDKRVEVMYIYMALLFGLLYMVILPPFSAPDEARHIDTAYYYSSQFLGQETLDEQGCVLYREDDALYTHDQNIPTAKSYELLFNNFWTTDHSEGTVSMGREPLAVPAISYLPQIIGVTIARLLHLGNIQMLMLGRLFTFLLSIACFYMAIKITPLGKEIIMLTGLLPMTLELITSFSYDALVISLSVLYTGFLMHLIFEVQQIQIKHWIVLAIIFAWLTPAKVVYICLAMTILCIPTAKFVKPWHKYVGTLGVLILGMIVILCTRLSGVTNIVNSATMEYTTYSIEYFMSNPKSLLSLAYNTVEVEASIYLQGMLGQSLGWMELTIPVHLIYGFFTLLIIASIRIPNEKEVLGAGQRFWSFLVIALTTVLIFVALLLDHTPVGSPYVLGVQGRYLLPMLPMLMMLFKNRQLEMKQSMTKYLGAAVYVLEFFVIMYIVATVAGR